MKRSLILCFLLATMLAVFTACEKEETAPILKVVIQDEDAEGDGFDYIALYPQGKTSETDEFVPDKMVLYTAEHHAFTSYIEDDKVHNSLQSTTLIGSDGAKTEADETISQMMQTAADTIDHDIWQFQVIVADDRYFAFVKLNVNWQSPCILYAYNRETNELTELSRWDGVNLIGISIP